MRSLALALALGLLCGCSGDAGETSDCHADLGGIWWASDGRVYHAIDSRRAVILYPLFASPAPRGMSPSHSGYSAYRIEFSRDAHSSARMTGARHQALTTRDGKPVKLRTPAELHCGVPALALEVADSRQHLFRVR